MKITTLSYSDDFVAFLDSIDRWRTNMIIAALNDFAKGELVLDPKTCEHFKNGNKVLLSDANVVVYYDIQGDTLVMINGSEVHTRVA